jgi:hypothetical protein
MSEAELTSELIIVMLSGINSKKVIESYYKDYDDKFNQASIIRKQFKECMDYIGEIYNDNLKNSIFSNKTMFYSLFCVVYHFKFGIKNVTLPRLKLNGSTSKFRNALDLFDQILNDGKSSIEFQKFIDVATKHTTDLESRKYRFEFMVKKIIERTK